MSTCGFCMWTLAIEQIWKDWNKKEKKKASEWKPNCRKWIHLQTFYPILTFTNLLCEACCQWHWSISFMILTESWRSLSPDLFSLQEMKVHLEGGEMVCEVTGEIYTMKASQSLRFIPMIRFPCSPGYRSSYYYLSPKFSKEIGTFNW